MSYSRFSENNQRETFISDGGRFAIWSAPAWGANRQLANSKWIIGLAKDVGKSLRGGYMAYKYSDKNCPYEADGWRYRPENGKNVAWIPGRMEVEGMNSC